MKRSANRLWMGGIAVLVAAGAALAANEIKVEIWDGGSMPRVTVFFDDGEAINAANGLPTILATDTRVNIYSVVTPLAKAGRITFTANARTSDLQVFLGT